MAGVARNDDPIPEFELFNPYLTVRHFLDWQTLFLPDMRRSPVEDSFLYSMKRHSSLPLQISTRYLQLLETGATPDLGR